MPTTAMHPQRLHTLIPRTTDRWKAIYRAQGTVEREFGRLKHEWGLCPLRVRRLPRVRLHADLAILVRPASALTQARAVDHPRPGEPGLTQPILRKTAGEPRRRNTCRSTLASFACSFARLT